MQYQDPPELDIDQSFAREFGQPVTDEQRLERAIVWNLCLHLQAHGFKLVAVDDGEEFTKTDDAKAAMELVFNLDESTLVFEKDGARRGVFLVTGNGCDIIADHSAPDPANDPGGFVQAMDSFDTEAVTEHFTATQERRHV